IEQSLQNQITAVYTFDAPGLHQELTQTAGYQRIMDRSKIFIPQGSIIGMALFLRLVLALSMTWLP
ncbi:Mbeg1-like protein, partial [Streptococcus pneumoniae]|uniref:Mbeg1-like protein n=1 Tax=Streptococcus pneumoniae TaxID=1313 RepID=UPI000ABE1D3F